MSANESIASAGTCSAECDQTKTAPAQDRQVCTCKILSESVIGDHHCGWRRRVKPAAIALRDLVEGEVIAIDQAALGAAEINVQASTKPIIPVGQTYSLTVCSQS